MRYLITGGAGFLGVALANHLVNNGHAVRVLDDLSTGDPARLDRRVLFSRGDVRNVPTLWTQLQEVECVYHLAARVAVSESILYPQEYNDVNVGGTVALLAAMRDVGVRRVVFISSGAVYGDKGEQPLRETAAPDPGSPYAVSKLAAEYYVRTIGALWGIETVCLRVFNAYGPGQHLPPVHAPVIPYMLRQARLNGTVVVHGDGQQTRDYVYVDDVVNAMVAAATAPEINGLTVNVGSGTEVSVRELARLAAEVTGGHPEIVFNPRNEGGLSRLRADLTLAREKLGYEPRVSLVDGLKTTLEREIMPPQL